jgi:hypothetical protein
MIVCATLLGTVPAYAQVHVEVVAPPPPRVQIIAPPPPRVVVAPPPPPAVRVQAPTITFAAPPPVVEIEPGVQVVEDSDQEIFFTGGYYWHAAPDGRWYRTRSYRGGWVAVSAPPAVLVRYRRGQYRHWKAERRAEHAERKEERREEKAERKWEKHQEHQGRGQGHQR